MTAPEVPSLLGVHWNDVITTGLAVLSAPAALVALFQTRTALRKQAISSDLQTALTVWDKLDGLWVRFLRASKKNEEFEFGQLVSYYELACGLYRDDILSTDAARTLKEHLRDLLPLMLNDPDYGKRFKDLSTAPDTFANIRWFVANHARSVTDVSVAAT